MLALTLANAFDIRRTLSESRRVLCDKIATSAKGALFSPLENVLALFACETLLGRRRTLSAVEYQLRRTFLHRVNMAELQTTLDEFYLRTSANSFVLDVL